MRKNYLSILVLVLGISLTANAFVIEWDKIEHWVGNGPNKAALVVQFDDGGEEKAYVWGYRWSGSDIQPSGEDMFRAIATESSDLYLFTQYTGWMGNTVCGIGYSPDNSIAGHIEYDFDSAMDDPCISFNWFSANTTLGQTSIPGWDTPDLCEAAIDEAKSTHILEHPIDARNYGYACYDYDHWNKVGATAAMRWHAGWYQGYWSYWVGGVDSESLSYSGLGYTSRKLTDGAVDAWKYTYLDGPVGSNDIDGVTGASTPWHELDYAHFNSTGIDNTPAVVSMRDRRGLYRLDGTRVQEGSRLLPGVYILIDGNKVKKIAIH